MLLPYSWRPRYRRTLVSQAGGFAFLPCTDLPFFNQVEYALIKFEYADSNALTSYGTSLIFYIAYIAAANRQLADSTMFNKSGIISYGVILLTFSACSPKKTVKGMTEFVFVVFFDHLIAVYREKMLIETRILSAYRDSDRMGFLE